MEESNQEKKFEKSIIKSKKLLSIVLIATLSALSISVSYILAPFVNIEIMSFIIFISGYLYGFIVGIGVGGISSLIFYGWNPYGPSNPPTYIACVSCMILFGIIGGYFRSKKSNSNSNGSIKYSAWNIYKFGIIGLFLMLYL